MAQGGRIDHRAKGPIRVVIFRADQSYMSCHLFSPSYSIFCCTEAGRAVTPALEHSPKGYAGCFWFAPGSGEEDENSGELEEGDDRLG